MNLLFKIHEFMSWLAHWSQFNSHQITEIKDFYLFFAFFLVTAKKNLTFLNFAEEFDKNGLKEADDVTLVIKPNKHILEPKIKVDGNEEIKAVVLIPDENESKEGIKRKIFIPKVHGTDKIDVEKLDFALKEVLKQFDPTEVFPNNGDISEMIKRSLMDYLDKNWLKEVDDVTFVIKPNKHILEPKIKVEDNEEIEAVVLIPNENEPKEGIKRKIFIPKVHGTDEIDVEKLDSVLKEVLKQFDPTKVFHNNVDISEMITKSLMDYFDKNGVKEANDVTLVIKTNIF